MMTPGAWFVDGLEVRATPPFRISGTLLASLNRTPVETAEAKANALAFAASKDMLDALRRLRGFALNYAEKAALDSANALLVDVDRAIAKAEGRAQ